MDNACSEASQANATLMIERMLEALHHSFGDNDLIVARRQLHLSIGEARARWTEIVDRLEVSRG